MTGDPGFFQLAFNEAYNFANIGFDHATETICIINFPLGATAKPFSDNEAGNRKPLHGAYSHGMTRPDPVTHPPPFFQIDPKTLQI